jgi:hypothetical protein
MGRRSPGFAREKAPIWRAPYETWRWVRNTLLVSPVRERDVLQWANHKKTFHFQFVGLDCLLGLMKILPEVPTWY